jgi:uncharacterized membrane protein YfcA
MFPLVLTGTTVGVLVNLSFPPIILNCCLCFILLILGIQSIFAAKKRYDKETKDLQNNQADIKSKGQKNLDKYYRLKTKSKYYLPDIRQLEEEPEFEE